MQIELDPQTAKIPWELLDTERESDDDLPWAIRVKLLRKLRITSSASTSPTPTPTPARS